MRKATLWEDRGITGYFPTLMAQKLRYIIIRAAERKALNVPDKDNGFLECITKVRAAIDAELKDAGFKVKAAKANKKDKDAEKALIQKHEDDMSKVAEKIAADVVTTTAEKQELESKIAALQAKVTEQEDELTELDAKVEEQASVIEERDNALATLNQAATKKPAAQTKKGGK